MLNIYDIYDMKGFIFSRKKLWHYQQSIQLEIVLRILLNVVLEKIETGQNRVQYTLYNFS